MVFANQAAVRLLEALDVDALLATRPGELAARFRITREDGSPVTVDDLPGQRLVTGRPGAPLLTRSVHRASGRERWLLTKASLLDDEGGVLAVNVIEDVTESKLAEAGSGSWRARAGCRSAGPPTTCHSGWPKWPCRTCRTGARLTRSTRPVRSPAWRSLIAIQPSSRWRTRSTAAAAGGPTGRRARRAVRRRPGDPRPDAHR
jgi:hypothetical protein